MEEQKKQQSKSKKKIKVISKLDIILLILLGVIILIISLFYFYPAPDFLNDKKGNVKRCFYKWGIGYIKQYSCIDCGYNFYNSNGEKLCGRTGWSRAPSKDSPCLNSKCFPIYNK